jgi:hypothetical protein
MGIWERESETEVLGWFDFLLEVICISPPPHHICELMDGANWSHVLLLEKARFSNVGFLRKSSKLQQWGRIEAMHRSIYKNKKMKKKRIRRCM